MNYPKEPLFLRVRLMEWFVKLAAKERRESFHNLDLCSENLETVGEY